MTGVDVLFAAIEEGRKGKNIGIKTGIEKMDKYTGGIQKSNYTLIFGLSGSGKTSYVLYAYIYRPLKDNPNDKLKIVYYSLEMSEMLLLAKLQCLYIWEEFGIVLSYKQLMSWGEILSDEIYAYVKKSKKWLDSIISRLIIHDKGLSAKSFYATMMTMLKEDGEFKESDNGRRMIYIPHDPTKITQVVIDHLGLCTPETGSTKKMEIDLISTYAVRFREKCQISFVMIMQENRNSSDMDRRKANLQRGSSEDIKDSGNPYNDCLQCINVYNPLCHGVKNSLGYPIIIENAADGQFMGLRDRYREICLIKNRLGESDRIVPVSFFGENGYFKEIPKAKDIKDFSQFLYLQKDSIVKDEPEEKEPSGGLNYSFSF